MYRLLFLLSFALVLHRARSACPTVRACRVPTGVTKIPFIAYIEFDNLHFNKPKPANGAGTIIDRNIVLTRAYHCEVAKASSFAVYAGLTYVQPKNRKYTVTQYAVHPARGRKTYDESKTITYYAMKYDYDFCLLQLHDLLHLSAEVQMAPIPRPNETFVTSNYLRVGGWGPYRDKDFVQGQRASEDYTTASIWYHETFPEPDNECRSTMEMLNAELTSDIFCLGLRCMDYHTATGDDGGPVLDTVSMKVVGMVINDRKLDKLETSQINAKLSFAVDWINEMRVKWAKPDVDDTFYSYKQKRNIIHERK